MKTLQELEHYRANLMTSLISLYSKMYDLMKSECDCGCRAPHSCCSDEYCGMADAYAREKWNIIEKYASPEPGKPRFLSASGCVLLPHLRPICTLHVCCIQSLGFKPGDPVWTKHYFDLRENIMLTETTLDETEDAITNMRRQP